MTEYKPKEFDIEKFNRVMEEHKRKNIERAKTLIYVPECEFTNKVESLFETCKKYLHGQYSLKSIYEDREKNPVQFYAVLDANYFETPEMNEEVFLQVLTNDAHILHKKLKESGIELDYYYIQPYFITNDRNSVLYNGNFIKTNHIQ